MFTLPDPTIRKSKANRSVKLSYATGVTNDEGERFAQVYVTHHADRKFFTASLNLVTVQHDGNFLVEKYMPFSGVSLARKPVARYSEKALDAFVEEVRELIPGLLDPTDLAHSENAVRIFRGEGQ